MNDIPLFLLFIFLFLLIIISAFFSSSETAMMCLNRYRLNHLAKQKHKGAIISQKLLARPDRLIGLILLGNNLVNIIAATVSTIIGMRLLGDIGVTLSPFILVMVFLIFAEVTPKTLAAFKPEKIAFPASYILSPLMRLSYPFVWIINWVSNILLKLTGIDIGEKENNPLSMDELRTIVHEAGVLIPKRHRKMLINILELENVTVDDIMVPSNEMVAIDIDKPIAEIINQLNHYQHTRIPFYKTNVDNMLGVLHVRRLLRIINNKEELNKEHIKEILTECYFVPNKTPLHTQLLNFQNKKNRFGFVVDEYGLIKGLVTLEDILEEIVGEFTTDMQTFNLDIQAQKDDSYLIDGSAHIREINKQLNWKLPADGAKTLNGLLLERLEYIPKKGISLKIDNYLIEITNVLDNAVKMTKIRLLDDDKLETTQKIN